jgi:mono/diheme cytochrome c family protein
MRISAIGAIGAAIVGIWLSPPGAAAEPTAPERTAAAQPFDEQIAPLLARRCLECHNPSDNKGDFDLTRAESALAGGASGAAIVAGKPEESYLWERVSGDEMPPQKPLSTADKQLLRDWIAAGAAWGQSPIDRFRFTSDIRAGYDWWALKPVQVHQPPPVRQDGWPRGAIDRFVLAKLEAAGLSPSPEADRRTLIRRVSFDLTGLPPSPEQVAAFVADLDPAAYEKLVDRLLASPDYGERWARHWLDVARFGESNGFEYDEPRHNAWPYRDWVIHALNRDLPFDEFVRQQLAGDALSPDEPEAIKATGFLVAGAYDTAGQNQQSAAMKAVVRQDELEDLVGTVCQTFLALTVNCARCHDHKFDPIRQADYYRLTSALGGVRHGERDVTRPADVAEFARRAAERQTRAIELAARIQALDEPIRARIRAERKVPGAPRPIAPVPLARWDFAQDLRDHQGGLHGKAQGGALVQSGGLSLDGGEACVMTVPLDTDLQAKTLEVWVSLNNLRQAGGGAISVQTLDGGVFDAIVFGEREPERWMAGSNGFARYRSFDGPRETEADKRPVHVAIVYGSDGTIAGYRNGQPYGTAYRGSTPVAFKAAAAQVVFGVRHGAAGGNKMLSGVIQRAQLYDRALTAEEVAASAGVATDFVSQSDVVARLAPDALAERRRLSEELAPLQAAPAPDKQVAYAVTPRQPEPAHLLLRGDSRQPGAVVSAGGVASLDGLSADFGLSPEAPEAVRRIALARWITGPQNPLFTRVIVNRLWHYHFGVGLVDTPNDFGFNGGRPTHPELLDYLAVTLVARNWSLKDLHREFVLSATYRQASMHNPAAARLDADNRWLWRRSPQRLEAEAVRDAMLVVAGQLNPARGGPGFRDCREVLRSGTYTYEPADPIGDQFNRRSVYRAWIRGGRNGLLDAFDCPDPSTTAPKRAVTTTPLQALALLNSAFVLRMADKFVERIEREAGEDVERRIARAYQLAFGRNPQEDELALARQIVGRHGLAVLARAIFNSNEFLYVD